MKVLLLAYACEPNKGSEPGVGWRWALEISHLGHEVWVLTRANNRETIGAELAKSAPVLSPHFLYYDLPRWARWWKKGSRGIYLYYLLWQWGAYRCVKRIHAHKQFDLVHHVTIGVIRQPSFMGRLGVPFIFGPVGGGESTAWRLRRGYTLRGWIIDIIRDIANLMTRIDPLMRDTFKRAEIIYVKTLQSRSIVPKKFWPKVRCRLEIGIDVREPISPPKEYNKALGLRVLYVGRFLYWKGMHLGLQAFAKLLAMHPSARLTMIGCGRDEACWRALIDRLGISKHITWIAWVTQDNLYEFYMRHDVLLFPSLHDSSGNVVLEALSYGLPVVCLDLGGPGVVVDHSCGVVISTRGAAPSSVIEELSQALLTLAQQPDLRKRLTEGALARAREYEWQTRIKSFYSDIQATCGL